MRSAGVLAAGLVLAPCAAAQAPLPTTDSTLALALRLVTEGQADSARALVRNRLRQLGPRDAGYPEAVFVSGVVAEDGDSALAAFRRVSIEFSQSEWADQALLRIAQLRFAAGDYATAGRSAERVLLDYPFSDVRAPAAFWMARVRLEMGDLASACGYLRLAIDEAAGDIELANRARFYHQRCAAVAPDSAPGDTATDATADAPGTPHFTVQVAAVGSAASADEVMRALRRAGFSPHVVRDTDGLFKVRVGRYTDRQRAERLRDDVRQVLGGTPFVVEEP